MEAYCVRCEVQLDTEAGDVEAQPVPGGSPRAYLCSYCQGEVEAARITAAAKAFQAELRRYRIEGTSDEFEGGPPYREPWLLIDTNTAPTGEMVGEYDTLGQASDEMWRRAAKAALEAVDALDKKEN